MSQTIAIIGASTDRAKYGNKSVRAFKDGGWTVYPVNAKADEVEGLKAYASISDEAKRMILYENAAQLLA